MHSRSGSRPRLLDLFCCAGGASAGYVAAGFDVVGVDLRDQPRYPFEFRRADALEYVAAHGQEFEAIHASPPCQRFSGAVTIANRERHVDLVGAVRAALESSGLPYVIENVPRAPLKSPIMLCGSSFGLQVRRHRCFESNVFMLAPSCAHGLYEARYPPSWNRRNPVRFLNVSGGFQYAGLGLPWDQYLALQKEAMGVDWDVTVAELSEAIPPVYTEYVGGFLMAEVLRRREGSCQDVSEDRAAV